jgi:hypothetical protein
MVDNRVEDLAPPQFDSDATNKKYLDTNTWSVCGNPRDSENSRVIGTLGEENFSIIRNTQLMLTFDGDGIKISKTFIFNTDVGPLGSFYMDSNSNMVVSAGRALYLHSNNTIRMTIANNVALNRLLLMGTNRISDLAPTQVDSDATNKKYVDTNSWSVRGNPLESETIYNNRVIGTLGEENFLIIRNNRTMFTFDGEVVRTSKTFIFDTNEGPLGNIYMD